MWFRCNWDEEMQIQIEKIFKGNQTWGDLKTALDLSGNIADVVLLEL